MGGSVSMIDGHIDEVCLRDNSVVLKAMDVGIETHCMICGEPVAIKWIYDSNKVCDKCRAAIMKMRSNMEQED